ncbi:hypothetical protein J7I88_17900 [Paraburkholderia strydomiana]|nr:hypothetical protein [Paraburkholderia strydomiana]
MSIDPRTSPIQACKLSVVLTFKVPKDTRSMDKLPANGDGTARRITFSLKLTLELND